MTPVPKLARLSLDLSGMGIAATIAGHAGHIGTGNVYWWYAGAVTLAVCDVLALVLFAASVGRYVWWQAS